MQFSVECYDEIRWSIPSNTINTENKMPSSTCHIINIQMQHQGQYLLQATNVTIIDISFTLERRRWYNF